MSKPINHSLIGAFIIGAVAIAVASIITLSSFSFNKKTYPFITYITDSVNGLSANSDVKFRGVKIGTVKEIKLLIGDTYVKDYAIPVVFEIDGKFMSDADASNKDLREGLKKAIGQGLRTRIQQANIVTGMLYIDIDFFPDTPAVFREKTSYGPPEIPSISSNMTQMANSISTILTDLAKIDFSKISEQLLSASTKLNTGLDAIEFKKINDNVVTITGSASKIMSSSEMQTLLTDASSLVKNANAMSEKLSTEISPLSKEFSKTTADLRHTLEQIDSTMLLFQSTMQSRQGSIGQDLSDAIEQINDAARSVRALSEYLQRNPNSLIFGKPNEQAE